MEIHAPGHRRALSEDIHPSRQSLSASELQTPLTIPSRQPTTGPGPHRLTLLNLPYELRLDIYELLLLAPDPIIVSSHRRQLRVKIEPPEHRIAYQRAPRPRPRVVTLTSKKPHVDILQTCKQVNHEATPLLYRGNDFIVGLRLGGRRVTRIEPADLAGFFLCSLRPTTLLHLSSMNFRGACQCDQWLSLPATAGYSVTGNELVSVCPDAWDYHQMVYLIISNALWNLEKDFRRLRICAFCNASSHGQHYIY